NASGVLEITKPTEVYVEGVALTDITRAIRALGQVDVFMGANKLNVASTTPPLLADASTAVLTINGNVVTNASTVATKSSSAA
ncbi:hypothetical protein NL393_37680, partial [Klebsiella pneumoniae]|nr:hypothetical protein [Klebsiella pneumoniae]